MGDFFLFSDFSEFCNDNFNAFKSQGLTTFQKRSVKSGYLFWYTGGGCKSSFLFSLWEKKKAASKEPKSAWV